jgi:demethylmenaquinone methyltransferase/2-methoxy-6-polyprenyl-1,4-benzoquinol methylase
MKVLESAPERYDRGMRLLTMGRLGQVHRDIAAQVGPGERVLDLGCGTGALAVLLARRGAEVTGIDISPPMLSQAARRVREEGLDDRVALRELGAVDLDTAFPDASFDAVVSTLVFSELSADEIEYTLAECRRILRPGGQLLIADEVLPDSWWGRIATWLVRLPFALLAFLLTQNTTHRVVGLGERIGDAGFEILDIGYYLAGTLQLFVAEKE